MADFSWANYKGGVWKRHIFAVFVWSIAVICVVYMFSNRSSRLVIVGLAQAPQFQILAPGNIKLKTVKPELFGTVEKGQVVAEFEDDVLRAQLAAAVAEKNRLLAELNATRHTVLAEAQQQKTSLLSDYREFQLDLDKARQALLEKKTLLAIDRAQLNWLKIKYDMAKELAERGVGSVYEHEQEKVEYETMLKKIDEQENVILAGNTDLEHAEKRCAEFAKFDCPDVNVQQAIEPLKLAVDVQDRLIEEFTATINRLTAVSPIDGFVSQILRAPNQSVVEGEQIMLISASSASEIVAYITQDQAQHIATGMEVMVKKTGMSPASAISKVLRIAPDIQMLPMRLWPTPTYTQYGRPVFIEMPPGLSLVPGEVVSIAVAPRSSFTLFGYKW